MSTKNHSSPLLSAREDVFSSAGALLSLVLSHTKEPFAVGDRSGQVRLFNTAMADRVKARWKAELYNGMPVLHLVPEGSANALRQAYEKALAGESATALVDGTPAGSTLPEQLCLQPVTLEQGQVNGVMITAVATTGTLPDNKAEDVAKENLLLLLANTEEAFAMLDSSCRITLFNQQAANWIRRERGLELKQGASVFKYNPVPERNAALEQICKDVFQGGSVETEFDLVGKDGIRHYYRVLFKPAYNPQNQIIACIITGREITRKRLVEQQLADYEQRWRFALESTQQGLWDWNIETGEVVYSDSWRKLLGYDAGEMENTIKEWEDRLHPDDRELMRRHRVRHFNSNNPYYESEFRLLAKDGSYRWILSRGMILERTTEGKPRRMIGTHTDITARKLIEEKYKLLFYKNPLPMWTYDRETLRFLEVNDAAISHYGYSRQEFMLMTVKDIRPEEELPKLMQQFKLDKTNDRIETKQWRHRKKNGEIIEVSVNGFIFEEGGKVITLVIAEDITEKLRAEERLKKSEKIYRHLFKNLPLPAFIYDPLSHQVLEANDAAIAYYGYSRKEFTERSLLDLHIPEQHPQLQEHITHNLPLAQTSISQWVHRKKDGELIKVEAWGSNIEYKSQQARLMIVHDITAKAKAEAELQASNERFELAAQATSDALYDWNLHTNKLKWGEGLMKLFGWQEQEVQFEQWEQLIHHNDRKQAIDSLKKELKDKSKKHWRSEYRFQKKDGSFAYVMDRGIVVRDQAGKPVRMIGAIEDITDLKLKEKELLESNKRFEYAKKATSDIVWDLDVQTEQILWADQYEQTFGWDLPENKLMTIHACFAHIHPDDFERIKTNMGNALKKPTQVLWEDEFRYQRKDGSYAVVVDRGLIIRNEAGKAVRMVGAMHDISQQKYQQELQELELRVFEASADPNTDFRSTLHTLITGLEQLHSDLYVSIALFDENSKAEVEASRFSETQREWVKTFVNQQKTGFRSAQVTQRSIVISVLDKKSVAEAGLDHIEVAWSVPVRNQQGDTLAVLSLFLKRQRTPTEQESGALNRMRNLLRVLLISHQAAEQIRMTNERYDNVMKATHDLVWDWNLETGLFYRHPEGIRRVYGVDESQIRDANDWMARIHPDDHAKVVKVINDILHATDEDTFDVEYRFLRDDGSYAYLFDRGIIIRNKEGKPVRMIGAAQDITQRKILEQELLQRELDRQKVISQATIDTQEQERTEIGKELHDNVNQILTTTKLYLDLSLSNPEMKDELIQKSSKNIIHVINEIRQLSRSLMDPSIGDLGLIDSIRDLMENINLTRRIKINLKADAQVDNLLDKQKKLMVFRIIQEALSNIIRHAQATTVKIKLKKEKENILLSIEDNGLGFEPEKVQKGIGLKNIRNRVYLANGTFQIHSAPGKGCHITIKFPINLNNPN